MTIKRILASTILAATCTIVFSEAGAQSLRRDAGPAENPPASFKANQYVDSKGCVYIRAGVDGNTNWVPRVSRDRKVVCGLSPSLRAGSGTAVAAAGAAAAPVQIGANTVSPKSPAGQIAVRPAKKTIANMLAPKPVRTVASTPAAPKLKAPVIQPARKLTRRVVQAPRVQQIQAPTQTVQPRIVRVAPQVQQAQAVQPRRVAVQQPRVATAQTCQGASAISQQYIGRNGGAVRCGPQDTPFVTRAGDVKNGSTFRSAGGQVLTNVSPNAIVVPRHVYEQQQSAQNIAPAPKGYREAWTDDRLNPRRAHQTLGGKGQTDLVWTQTVPRRLILASTGRDVTRMFPGLRYPYTSAAQQNAGWNQGVQVISTKSQAPRRVKQQVVRKQKVVRQQNVAPARAVAPNKTQTAVGRYVQVGTFGVPSNAQNTAHRLQRMGLPVRIGKVNRGGRQLQIVLAGPFASSAHTNGALNAVRNAGFRDAFARR